MADGHVADCVLKKRDQFVPSSPGYWHYSEVRLAHGSPHSVGVAYGTAANLSGEVKVDNPSSAESADHAQGKAGAEDYRNGRQGQRRSGRKCPGFRCRQRAQEGTSEKGSWTRRSWRGQHEPTSERNRSTYSATLDEQTYRFNNRHMTDAERFDMPSRGSSASA